MCLIPTLISAQAAGAVDSVSSELRRLWVAEGVSGFYKGNGANCLKVAPTKGIQCVLYLKREDM